MVKPAPTCRLIRDALIGVVEAAVDEIQRGGVQLPIGAPRSLLAPGQNTCRESLVPLHRSSQPSPNTSNHRVVMPPEQAHFPGGLSRVSLFPNGAVQTCREHYLLKTEVSAERLSKEIEASMRGQGYFRARLDENLGYLLLFPAEPPREKWRLQLVRGWSHEEQDYLPCGTPRAGRTPGAGAPRGVWVRVGGAGLDRAEAGDRGARDVAPVGAAG